MGIVAFNRYHGDFVGGFFALKDQGLEAILECLSHRVKVP